MAEIKEGAIESAPNAISEKARQRIEGRYKRWPFYMGFLSIIFSISTGGYSIYMTQQLNQKITEIESLKAELNRTNDLDDLQKRLTAMEEGANTRLTAVEHEQKVNLLGDCVLEITLRKATESPEIDLNKCKEERDQGYEALVKQQQGLEDAIVKWLK